MQPTLVDRLLQLIGTIVSNMLHVCTHYQRGSILYFSGETSFHKEKSQLIADDKECSGRETSGNVVKWTQKRSCQFDSSVYECNHFNTSSQLGSKVMNRKDG